MRRSLTLFLVTLLVLRGLLGDAMAMSAVPGVMAMSASQTAMQAFTGGHDPHSDNATYAEADTHDHASHSNHSDDADEPHEIEHVSRGQHASNNAVALASASISADAPAYHAACPSSDTDIHADAAAPACSHEHGAACSACGICHSAVFVAGLWAQPSQPQPNALRAVGNAHFDSAAAALVVKPPIS